MPLMTALLGRRQRPSDSEARGAEAWLQDVGGDRYRTNSGKSISTDDSLSLSAVYAAARAVSEDLAGMPLKAFRHIERGKQVAKDEPRWFSTYLNREVNLYSLAHDVSAPNMINYTLRSLLVWWAQLYGNGYAEIVRDSRGRPEGLCPIHPHRVTPKWDKVAGVFYAVRDPFGTGEERDIWPEDIIKIMGPSSDGVIGNITTEYAADAFAVYMAAEQHAARFFSNNATLAGVVSFDQQFKTAEARAKYRAEFDRVYAGAANAGKWMLADNGARVTTLSVDPEKSQLAETIKFRIEDVARWFRVPPVIIGHNTGTPYANIEPLGRFYYEFGLKPWALRIEQEFDMRLGTSDIFFEHVVDSLMWSDPKTRTEVHAARIRAGISSPNEARAVENMNPYEGGDAYRVEQNLAMLDSDGAPQQANAPQRPTESGATTASRDAIKLAIMPVVVDAASRVIAREVNAVTKKKVVSDEWLASYYAGHRDAVVSMMQPSVEAVQRIAGVAIDSSVLDRFADAHVAESVRRIKAGEDISAWKVDRPAWIAVHITDEVLT